MTGMLNLPLLPGKPFAGLLELHLHTRLRQSDGQTERTNNCLTEDLQSLTDQLSGATEGMLRLNTRDFHRPLPLPLTFLMSSSRTPLPQGVVQSGLLPLKV